MELASIKNLSRQEIFDFVAPRLIAQGKPSMAPRDYVPLKESEEDGVLKCAYQSPDGSRCAVGLMMSEDEIKRVIEFKLNTGCGIGRLSDKLDIDLGPYRTSGFLSNLQTVHDGAEPDFGDIVQRLRSFAEVHRLSDEILPA